MTTQPDRETTDQLTQADDRCEHLVTEQAGSSYLRCKDCGVLKEITLNSSISAGLSVKTASEEIATDAPDDLVERLTKRANTYTWDSTTFYTSDAELMLKAAACIKELKAEVARLRAEPLARAYVSIDRFEAMRARAAKAEEALRRIKARATTHPDDNDSDRKRDLRHVVGIAREALGEEKA